MAERCRSCNFVTCRCGDPIDLRRIAPIIEAVDSAGSVDAAGIRAWIDAAHAQSVRSGFYDDAPPKDFEHIAARLMLAVCELSEATEELRNNPDPLHVYTSEKGKPEGFPIEIADAVIRLLDLCGWLGIDLANAMAMKAAYNATRPRRHGKVGL